jgi:hypothetical protein
MLLRGLSLPRYVYQEVISVTGRTQYQNNASMVANSNVKEVARLAN